MAPPRDLVPPLGLPPLPGRYLDPWEQWTQTGFSRQGKPWWSPRDDDAVCDDWTLRKREPAMQDAMQDAMILSDSMIPHS